MQPITGLRARTRNFSFITLFVVAAAGAFWAADLPVQEFGLDPSPPPIVRTEPSSEFAQESSVAVSRSPQGGEPEWRSAGYTPRRQPLAAVAAPNLEEETDAVAEPQDVPGEASDEGPAEALSSSDAPSAAPALGDVPAQTVRVADRFPGIELVGVSGWDAESEQTVLLALSVLPSGIRQDLGNPQLGDLLILVNRQGATSSGHQPYGGPANFFSTNEGRNEVVLFPAQPVLTVLHELGHAYSLRGSPAGDYASVLLGEEMVSFMDAAGWRVETPASEIAQARDHGLIKYSYEGAVIWHNLSREDPLEDFANSFALYLTDPSALNDLSPSRYAWFAARFPG